MSFALISFFTSGGGGAIRNQISQGIGSASIKVRLAETTERGGGIQFGRAKKKESDRISEREKIARFELKLP